MNNLFFIYSLEFKKYILAFFFLNSWIFFSQENVSAMEYIYNPSFHNPSYVGQKGFSNLFFGYRANFIGIENAPDFSSVSFETPFTPLFGAALSISRETLGPSIKTDAFLSFSYRFPVSDLVRISLGIKTGVSFSQIDYSNIKLRDENDRIFQDPPLSKYTPNLGFSGSIYGDKWNIDVGFTKIDRIAFGFSKNVISDNIYFSGGYIYKFPNTMASISSILYFRYALESKAPDSSMAVRFRFNRYSFGFGYRYDKGINLFILYKITTNIVFGYNYGMDFNDFSTFHSGNQGVSIRFDFFRRHIKNFYDPRFF